jgi:hypothetical protein
MKKYDDIFALTVVKNAIIVTADALNAVPTPELDFSNKLLASNGAKTTPRVIFTDDCVVSWVELYHASEIENSTSIPAVLVVTDLEGNPVTHQIEKPAKLAAISLRVAQIQQELGITDKVTDDELIFKLLERAWNNEWMGQFDSGRLLYFSELADLLNIPMGDIWPIVDELVTARKADVLPSSWILVAPKGDTPRRGTEEYLGHKELSMSDFGWWNCSYCNQSGDDYSDPQDYNCSKD